MSSKNYLPTKRINELWLAQWYGIYKAKVIDTKFGKSVMVWLCNYESDEKCVAFLPSRYNYLIKNIETDDSPSEPTEEDTEKPKAFCLLHYYDIAYIGDTKLPQNRKKHEIEFRLSEDMHIKFILRNKKN